MSTSSGPAKTRRADLGALAVLGALTLAACAAGRPPSSSAAAAAVAPPPTPFEEGSASFTVRGARFAPGETAIIRVCVNADGSIASADIVGSSGDKRFDDFALLWSRQVRLRSVPPGARTETLCGPVRVEIHPAATPEAFAERSSAVG